MFRVRFNPFPLRVENNLARFFPLWIFEREELLDVFVFFGLYLGNLKKENIIYLGYIFPTTRVNLSFCPTL